jgi:hypothetical protein
MNYLPDERTQRISLIEKLHNDGMSDRDISEYLNREGLKTPRNRNYYPELVFGTRKKIERRKNREKGKNWELVKVGIFQKI